MKNEIIKGDFPEGSNIDFTNYFSKEDIGISWKDMHLYPWEQQEMQMHFS